MSKLALPRFTFWRGVLLVILAFGLFTTVVRFSQGLGAATNLSDAFPWGLWVGFDILCGVALAAGGFTISSVVYIFNIKRFKPIVKPAILTAFLGYGLVVFALLYDLGRPYRVWHPLVWWNPHSVMFEVGWCVTLYTTVLAIEFSPLVFERFGWKLPLKVMHAVMPLFVILGVLLSTLHQSSLGSFYLIVPYKLHPLWYSPLLPVFFFLTALTLGCAMTIVESFLSARAFKKALELDLLVTLGRIAAVLLAINLVLKMQDLGHRGVMALAFQPTYEGRLFLAEMLLGFVTPLVLLLIPAVRRTSTGLFVSALMIVLGIVMNRLNVSITGMERSSGVTYLPTWMEVSVTLLVVGVGFLLFALAVRYLPIFPAAELERPAPQPSLAGGHILGRPLREVPVPALGLAFLALAGSVALGYDGVRRRDPVPVRPKADRAAVDVKPALAHLTLPADLVVPQAKDSPGKVTFSHSFHVDAAAPDCLSCHRSGYAFLGSGGAPANAVSYHDKKRCGSCHDGSSASAIEDGDCAHCHK